MHRSQRPAQARTFPENNRIGCALIDASMSRRRPCLRRAQPSLFPPPEYCVYLKEPTRPPRRSRHAKTRDLARRAEALPGALPGLGEACLHSQSAE